MKLAFWVGAFALLASIATTASDVVSYTTSTPIGTEPRIVQVEPAIAVAARGRIEFGAVAPDKRNAVVYGVLQGAQAYARENTLNVIGPPILINHRISDTAWDFEFMVPVAQSARTPLQSADVSIKPAPSGRALAMDHHGGNDTIFDAYRRLATGVPAHQLGDLTWEQYITDPSRTPTADQRTRIFRALRPD